MRDLFSLNNKIIAITGGYSHLGTSISKGLVQYGAKVIVLGKDEKKFVKSFSTNSQNIYFEFCDISSTESIKKSFNSIQNKFKCINVLINNAIYLKGQNPELITDEEWSFGIDGTLNSVYRCIREVIPFMKKNKTGKIINVSSMYGIVSPDFSIYKNNLFLNPPHYGCAKAGVLQLTRYFATYLAKYNISVNAVSPGPFPNKNVQKNKSFVQLLKNKTPVNRVGSPDDLKGVFVFLCSDASSYIIGQNIIIDGGWTIW